MCVCGGDGDVLWNVWSRTQREEEEAGTTIIPALVPRKIGINSKMYPQIYEYLLN